ncbi:hypothetical protein [Streptomyces sp. AC550_RSS872]|uniref:hypothetical protein n=1 Tax=Streptomyces sp. AC550_RSS872 TaxID=2823689 RepID=UPI0020B87827|nr:hypothetical protein [Streptomyces sp. AC550_RSS872]
MKGASGVKEASTDFGHIVASSPLGVVTARSTADVRELVSFAGPAGLPVSARGAGQAL